MAEIKIEMGKLMAQFSSLNASLQTLQNKMENTTSKLDNLHREFLSFTDTLLPQMTQHFIRRSELAPFKRLLSVVAVTLFSAICLSLTELILARYF